MGLTIDCDIKVTGFLINYSDHIKMQLIGVNATLEIGAHQKPTGWVYLALDGSAVQ